MNTKQVEQCVGLLARLWPERKTTDDEIDIFCGLLAPRDFEIAVAAIKGHKLEYRGKTPNLAAIRSKILVMEENAAAQFKAAHRKRDDSGAVASASADDETARAWMSRVSDAEIEAMLPALRRIVMMMHHGMMPAADRGTHKWNQLDRYVMPQALTPERVRGNRFLRGFAFALATGGGAA